MTRKERRKIEYQSPLGKIYNLGTVTGSSENEIGRKGKAKVDAFKKKRGLLF